MPVHEPYDGYVLDSILGDHHSDRFPDDAEIVLWAVLPADDGTGGVEVTGPGYAALPTVNASSEWPDAVAGVKGNGTTQTFGPPTGDWTTAAGVGVRNPLTGEAMLSDELAEAFTAADGDSVVFDPGTIALRLRNL